MSYYKDKVKLLFTILVLIFSVFILSNYKELSHYFSSQTDISNQLAQVGSSLTSGLVAYYNFDSGSGTSIVDQSGNGNSGTLVNGPTWVIGKVGSGALYFDGSDDYLNVPASASLDITGGNFTISFWLSHVSSNDSGTFLLKGNSSTNGIRISRAGTGSLGLHTYQSSTNQLNRSDNNHFVGSEWVHVTVVREGAVGKIYFNGNEVSNYYNRDTIINPTSAYSESLKLFSGPNNYYSVRGTIDELRVYNRALSSSEISEVYNFNGSVSTPAPTSTPVPTVTPTPTPIPTAVPAQDTQAPSTPTNLVASVISDSQINLSWNTSTDDVAVSGYKIYRNSSLLTAVSSNSYSNTGLSASTDYSYRVSSYDSSGNESPLSSSATVTTNAAPLGSPTISGSLILSSTFESISVKANFSSDTDNDNSAAVYYKKTTDSSWLSAFTPFVDRRTTLSGSQNLNVNQARVSIVGLESNTTYDVKIVWSDPDGVSNTSTVLGQVSTLSYNPQSSGTVRVVASDGSGSYLTIDSAISASSPGDIISIKPGTYAPFTVPSNKSGTSNAYLTIQGQGSGVVISGGSVNQNVIISANYIRLKQLEFQQTNRHSIFIDSNVHHVYIEDTIHTNIGGSVYYGGAGVYIRSGTNNIYILRNNFNTSHTVSSGIDAVFAVYFESGTKHTFVITDNTVTGGFRDGIGGAGNFWNGGAVENSDIARNTIGPDFRDDGIEMEGDNINVRIYGNSITRTANGGEGSGFGLAPTLVGPLYVFRNTYKGTVGVIGVKQANSANGPAYFIHNTFSVKGSGTSDVFAEFGGGTWSELHYYYNNILEAARYPIYRGGRSNVYDYNLYNPIGGAIADEFNTSSTYYSLVTFRSATGNEVHGIQSSPGFNVGNLTISNNSSAIDNALPIPNFNGINSSWASSGSGPDIGAYEYGNAILMSTPTPTPTSAPTPTPIVTPTPVVPTPTPLLPDTTSPTISITSPSNNTTISNTVTISSTASDPTIAGQTTSGILAVQFKLDNINLGQPLTTAPYSGTWNTQGVSNGSHTLTAVATDVAGNTTTSNPITISISNTIPSTPTPTSTPTPANPSVPTPTPTPSNPATGGGTTGGGGGGTTGAGSSSTSLGNSSSGGGSSVGTFTPTVPQKPLSTLCTPSTTTVTKLAIPTNLTNLAYGTRNASVLELQNLLIKAGYLAQGYNTGFYGLLTRDALNKYKLAPQTQTITKPCVSVPPLTTSSRLPPSYIFSRSLKLGSTGTDVKNLQIFLNNNGFTVSTTGIGSKGNESTYFGPATAKALAKYQEYYAKDILTPSGLTKGTGYFGPSTMKKVNGR